MEGVEKVEQLDDTHLAWTAEIGGITKELDRRDHRAEARRADRLACRRRRRERRRRDVPPARRRARPGSPSSSTSSPRARSRRSATRSASSPAARRATWSASRSSSRRVATRPAPGAGPSRPAAGAESPHRCNAMPGARWSAVDPRAPILGRSRLPCHWGSGGRRFQPRGRDPRQTVMRLQCGRPLREWGLKGQRTYATRGRETRTTTNPGNASDGASSRFRTDDPGPLPGSSVAVSGDRRPVTCRHG